MLSTQEQPYILPTCEEELSFIYEDEAIIVCNKPSGLLSVPGKHPLNQDSVLTRLQSLYPQAQLAHRLDLDTSGILLAAKTSSFQAILNKQFAQRQTQKQYLAMVDGHFNIKAIDQDFVTINNHPLKLLIDKAMGPDKANKPKQKLIDDGKPAQSVFELIHYDDKHDISLLKLSPLTGRSHQLRLHAQSLGFALLGCDLYAPESVYLKASRLCLHASFLEFNHPIKQSTIQAHCPIDFSSYIQSVEATAKP